VTEAIDERKERLLHDLRGPVGGVLHGRRALDSIHRSFLHHPQTVRLDDAAEDFSDLRLRDRLAHAQRRAQVRQVGVADVQSPGVGQRGDHEPHVLILEVDHETAARATHDRRVLRADRVDREDEHEAKHHDATHINGLVGVRQSRSHPWQS
jgi:hypothetical protein